MNKVLGLLQHFLSRNNLLNAEPCEDVREISAVMQENVERCTRRRAGRITKVFFATHWIFFTEQSDGIAKRRSS
jgi:hypothetical protein